MGEFTISVSGVDNTADHHESNLFTMYGISSVYKTGEHVIIDDMGGIFKHCRLGTGIGTLTPESTGLSEGIAITSTLQRVKLRYFDDRGISYAQGILEYIFDTDFEGTITEIMLTEMPQNIGMLCGKTLVHPIHVKSGEEIKVTYIVNIPIIKFNSLITETVSSREAVTLHGGIFNEYPDRLVTALPLPSERVTNGHLTTMYVDGIKCDDGNVEYECDVAYRENGLTMTMSVGISPRDALMQVIEFGTTSNDIAMENMRWKVRYGNKVQHPPDKSWKFSFVIDMEVR